MRFINVVNCANCPFCENLNQDMFKCGHLNKSFLINDEDLFPIECPLLTFTQIDSLKISLVTTVKYKTEDYN